MGLTFSIFFSHASQFPESCNYFLNDQAYLLFKIYLVSIHCWVLEKCSQQLNVSIFTRNTPTQGLSTLRFYTFSSFSVGCCINKENIIYYLSSETTYIDVLKLPVFDLHALHASKRMTIVAHAILQPVLMEKLNWWEGPVTVRAG